MRREREGELMMLLLSILEGLFPILSLLSISLIGAIHSYAYVTLIATVVLAGLLAWRGAIGTLWTREAQRDLLLTTFFITALFVLIFVALRYTTAGNVAVLVFLQLLFAYLYFHLFGQERMRRTHSIGALLMGAGGIIVLLPADWRFNLGDGLALLAAAIAPIANLYQKRARAYVGTLTILVYRNLLALPLLFALASLLEPRVQRHDLAEALPYLLANGLLIYVVAKILWVEALHRISITKVSAMLALVPIFTLLFAYWILGEAPSMRQWIGMVPILLGGYWITRADPLAP
jgi:drug/metabolite transporter (DMT)-like permease